MTARTMPAPRRSGIVRVARAALAMVLQALPGLPLLRPALLAAGLALPLAASALPRALDAPPARAADAPDQASPPAASTRASVTVVDLDITGLDDEETASARAAITLARLANQRRAVSEARLQFLLRRVPDEVLGALEPFGWYAPSVEVRREPVRDGLRIVVAVDRGEPTTVASFDADIDGDARDDRFVMRELPKIGPREGERLVHAEYEAGKLRIDRKLAERGYFDARRTASRVEVQRAAQRADVRLRWASGPRHAMGEARFGENQFRPGLLEPLVDWEAGDAFHRNRLLRLQQRLAQLDYFALIEVVPLDDEEAAGLEVPIEITTTPAKRTSYSAALSVGTDTGFGVRGGLNRRWVNDRGHKWLADAEWTQRRSSATTQYRVPSLRRLPGWWAGEVAWLAEDPETALGFERLGVAAGWQGRREPLALSARMVFAKEETRSRLRLFGADVRQTLLYPELSATWREVDDFLNPEEALQVTLTLRGGAIDALARRRFAQAELGVQWLETIDARQRLVLRADLATTAYDGNPDTLEFPTSLRYFAGGDRSIRGYGYREVGPRFAGEVIGGLHRAVASAEYQYFLRPEWGAAVFVDAGDTFNSRAGFDPKIGVGVGARWRSPVGLVGVDVAHGLDADAGGGTRLHLSFGVGF